MEKKKTPDNTVQTHSNASLRQCIGISKTLVGANSRWRPGACSPLSIANRRQETAPTSACFKFIISVLFLSLYAAIFLFTGILGGNVRAEEPKSNPHELKEQFDSMECANCHRQTPVRIPENHTRAVLPGLDDFVVDPVTMCVPCHEGSMDSHPIAIRPKYLVPADLPLDKKRGISCLTCHYTHGSLKSDRPCCCVSLLDRMFDRKRMRKSFLLRRENTNGELCKACHVK